jgi:FlaG/FlaF family flagellin (archaellin)
MVFRRDRNATKVNGRETYAATMAALISTLTCMLGFTASASKPRTPTPSDRVQEQKASQTARRTVRVVVDGKEVQGDGVTEQRHASGRRTTSVKWRDDHGSGTISARDIELTTDLDDVHSIAKDGYLVIDETRDGIRRRLKIEPASDGKLKRAYSVKGVLREMDEEDKAWLSRILHDFLDSSRRE